MRIGVTGTPGTGKTSVAKRLSEELSYRFFSLDDLVISEGLYMDYDEERGSYVVDLDRFNKWFRGFNRFEDVVYEGLAITYLDSGDLLDKVIVLRCSPYKLVNRLRDKGFPPRKIRENVQAEILDVVLSTVVNIFGWEKVVQVDNSGSIEYTLSKILGKLEKEGGGCDSVDWLQLIMENGDLEKFLG